jgi:hypothetical protein
MYILCSDHDDSIPLQLSVILLVPNLMEIHSLVSNMEQERDSLIGVTVCSSCTTCLHHTTAQREKLEGNHGAGAFRHCGVTTLKVDLHGGNQP